MRNSPSTDRKPYLSIVGATTFGLGIFSLIPKSNAGKWVEANMNNATWSEAMSEPNSWSEITDVDSDWREKRPSGSTIKYLGKE